MEPEACRRVILSDITEFAAGKRPLEYDLKYPYPVISTSGRNLSLSS